MSSIAGGRWPPVALAAITVSMLTECTRVSGERAVALRATSTAAKAPSSVTMIAIDGGTMPHATPEPARPAEPIIALSAGTGHTCALHRDGRVSCWGDNGVGQAGGPPTADRGSDPHFVPLPETASQIAAGHFHTCVLDRLGDVWCFGSFLGGTKVSDGSVSGSTALDAKTAPSGVGVPRRMLATMGAVDRVRRVAVSLSTSRACALRGRQVVCWSTTGQQSPAIVTETMDVGDAEDLAVGAARACVISKRDNKRRMECWELGDKRPTAAAWTGAAPAEISMGTLHTCARDVRGDAYCWRISVVGTHFWKKAPQRITNLGKGGARSVSAGADFACAASGDGSVGCFLAEPEGLPDEVVATAWAAPRSKARTMAGVDGAVLVAAGMGRNVFGHGYACALRTAGNVMCWGDGEMGQLGDGKREVSSGAVEVLPAR